MSIPEAVKRTMTGLVVEWNRQLKADKARLAEMEQDISGLRERMATLEQAITETEAWLNDHD